MDLCLENYHRVRRGVYSPQMILHIIADDDKCAGIYGPEWIGLECE